MPPDYHLEGARLLLAQMAARPAATETQDMRAKTEEHYAAAKKLIEDTGYKRRVPELEAICACLDGEILLPAAEEVARSVQRLRSRELPALRSESEHRRLSNFRDPPLPLSA